MLQLEVEPGLSLGNFRLGMRLSEAIQVTNEYSADKSDPFNRVDIVYCKKDPLGNPITIKYDQGFKLQFNPVSQHLELIEIFNTAPLLLSYRGKKFCTPDLPPTYNSLWKAFGPTVSGDFTRSQNELMYHSTYPGMSLLFSVPTELEEICTVDKDVLPTECWNIPLTSLILQENLERSRVKVDPLPHIDALVGEGINIQGAEIKFASSPQEVVSEIGSPEAIFTKTDDMMRLHTPNSDEDTGDYFYNYFQLGLDILFDGISHTAKKFVFHTNFPSHYLFNCKLPKSYVKCNFSVQFPVDCECLADAPRKKIKKQSPALPKPQVPGKEKQKIVQDFDSGDEDDVEGGYAPDKDEKEGEDLHDEFIINGNTSWKAVEAYLGIKGRPFIFNFPAGSTKVYGYPGLAVEVLDNGFLGCVYMFPSS